MTVQYNNPEFQINNYSSTIEFDIHSKIQNASFGFVYDYNVRGYDCLYHFIIDYFAKEGFLLYITASVSMSHLPSDSLQFHFKFVSPQ